MTTTPVVDAADATFASDVIERSNELPVVVDFWAPWCGPCRLLGPLLEQVAGEYAGQVQLVKVNTDENPQVSLRYRIQGIPAVIAFRGGEPINQFVGALPEPEVRHFFQAIVPSDVDRKVTEAEQLLHQGQPGAARAAFEAVLGDDPEHQAASLGLASLLATTGEYDRATTLASKWPGDPAAKRVLGIVNFQRAAGDADAATLVARLAANDADSDAHYKLGNVLAVQGDWPSALEHLLATVRLDRSLENDGGRVRLLDAFNVLGEGDALTQEYRRKLGALLF